MMHSRIYLCWFPGFPLNQVRPVLTLDQLLDQANRGDPVAQRRMVRLNWIVQDLDVHGMRKPIVVDHDFATIVGDNRIMALKILGRHHELPIPVLAQLQAPQGHVIHDLGEIPDLVGLGDRGRVSWRPEQRDPLTEPVDWFDVGDRSTAGYPAYEGFCEQSMRHYLDHNPTVRFTPDWCRQRIDWNYWCYFG